jgi:glycosyltransferase involved in cell wall biosynthesis
MRSRNILFFVSSLRTGGAELHVLNLCRYLAGKGTRVSVCTLSLDGNLMPRFEELGVPVYDLSIGSLRDLARSSVRKRIERAVAASDPDILHAHMYHAEIVAALASARSGIPLVVTRHSFALEFNGTRRIAASIARRWIRRVIAVSDEAAGEAVRLGATHASVVTIPNGVDTARFKPLDPALRDSERTRLFEENFAGEGGADPVLIGSVSGLKPVKNFPMLVKAFVHLGGARMMIAGEGSSRGELEDLVEKYGLDGTVSLPGHLDRPEEYLPLFDIFVLPSRTEGVPMALLEAMSCGAACVASRVGGIPDLLGECGIMFSPGDQEGLTDILKRLVSDPGLRSDLGRRARIRAMEYFDLEIWGSRTEAVYEDAAGMADKSSP